MEKSNYVVLKAGKDSHKVLVSLPEGITLGAAYDALMECALLLMEEMKKQVEPKKEEQANECS